MPAVPERASPRATLPVTHRASAAGDKYSLDLKPARPGIGRVRWSHRLRWPEDYRAPDTWRPSPGEGSRARSDIAGPLVPGPRLRLRASAHLQFARIFATPALCENPCPLVYGRVWKSLPAAPAHRQSPSAKPE